MGNKKTGCSKCIDAPPLPFDVSMAFQPIVNLETGAVFAQEALVRGTQGEPASSIFAHVNEDNQYQFDQTCRVKAIEMASKVGVDTRLSINFMPNAVYRAETCIQTTLRAAAEFEFPLDKIVFEITEADRVPDKNHLRNIIDYYKQRGFMTAIDDFGAGYAGLNLLADFIPDLVKLDMELVRNIDQSPSRLAIGRHMIGLCHDLGIEVIAEGIESRAERDALSDLGIRLFQGYYFARPAFESIAEIDPVSLS